MIEQKKELSIIRLLFDLLNSEDIRYCHWKSNQHFCDALTGIDDLDILIDRLQYGKIVDILYKLKFKRFIVPKAREYVGIEDYIGFDYELGELIHLHLHSRMVVGEKHLKGFHLPIENNILSNRRFDNEYNVYMTSYFDELFLLLLRLGMKIRKRDIIKKEVLSTTVQEEMYWLKERYTSFEEDLESIEWISARIKKSLQSIYHGQVSWIELMKLKKYIYKDLSVYSQGSEFYNTVKRNAREYKRIILEIKKRFLHTKFTLTRRRPATGGLIVSFLGSDGAGKSSTIAEIRKWLYDFVDVRYFYLGSGDGECSLFRYPLVLLLKAGQKIGVIKKSNNFNDSNLKEIANTKLNFYRKLWIYFLSRERIKKIKNANRCRIHGFIVLTDRYPQSEFSGLCDGPRMVGRKGIAAKKEYKCFQTAKMCPPDLVIKLIVPPEIAVSRKPGEIDVETSRRLTERVRMIQFDEHTKSFEVDSAQEKKRVQLLVKRAIWESIG